MTSLLSVCRKLEIQFDRISSFNFWEILNIANCNSNLKKINFILSKLTLDKQMYM
jgi:hypothetical protein